MSEIKFRTDTRFRKQMFIPDSFQHPAKMSAPLLLWIVEKYTQPGETILDCMAGSGTAMLACTLGRHVVLVELEEKYIKICRSNWEKVRQRPQLGSEMGTCQILQGDARNLEGLLADKCIFSPPYVTGARGDSRSLFWDRLANDPTSARYGRQKHPSLGEEYSDSKDNIGNLPYGSIDKIIASPPYADSPGTPSLGSVNKDDWGKEGTDIVKRRGLEKGYSKDTEGQIGNLKYGDIDAIVTSPPYENQIHRNSDEGKVEQIKAINPSNYVEHSQPVIAALYNPSKENIGNLKSTSYLSAMEFVYRQCFKVLKPGGLMILVTKNFLRDQKEVRLDSDTISIAERAGFKFLERHYRHLPSQSFWRIIYRKKYPLAPVIDKEDILVFEK